MVTIDNLLRWEHKPLDVAADALVKRRQALTDLQDELDGSVPPETWLGDAGDDARAKHQRMTARLLDMTAEVADIVMALDEGGTEIGKARLALESALDLAASKQLVVDHATGRVTDERSFASDEDAASSQADVDNVAGMISDALTNAETADSRLAAALTAAARGKVDGGSGSLMDATAQLPPSLDGLTPGELAKKLGEGVAKDTITAYLNAELDLASFELEGGIKGQYQVNMDGKVVMSLHLEGGLGRQISAGGAELSASGGLTTDLELSFDDEEAAQKFIDGLDNAAFDLGWRDIGNPPAAVVQNVAEYVMKQDITSFRAGAYIEGEAKLDSPWVRASLNGRGEVQYDFVKQETVVSLSAERSTEFGSADNPAAAYAAGAEGKVKIDGDGPKEFSLKGSLDAQIMAKDPTIPLEMLTAGGGADVEVTVSRDNPHWDEIEGAVTRGDLQEAKELAYQHGKVVYRTFLTEEMAHSEQDIDLKVGKLEYEAGLKAEQTAQVWVKPEGQRDRIQIPTEGFR